MCDMCSATGTFDPVRHMGSDAAQTILEATDASADRTTTLSMAVGDVVSGALDVGGDADWISIGLTAGSTYGIGLAGNSSGSGSLADPYLTIYDSSGRVVATNDDGGTGYDSFLRFTPGTSGTYYLGAGSYQGNSTGTYTLSVTEIETLQPASHSELARFLTDGYWTRRAFDTSSDNIVTVNLTALTIEGQLLARAALDLWETVADIEFAETNGAAEITFDDDEAGAFARSYTSNGRITSAEVNVSTDWLSNYGTQFGSYSFQTYLHEIGHALGLGHQGAYNGAADYTTGASFANDSWQVSVMSYFSQSENTSISASLAWVLTPMIADIIAIQSLYGAPRSDSATAGDTIWGPQSAMTTFLPDYFAMLHRGEAAPQIAGGPAALTIYDASGTDTLDLSFSSAGDRIDLNGGRFSDLGGLIGNLAIAHGTIIENLVTGAGNDTIRANLQNNRIHSGDGNDVISALAGHDVVSAGEGDDLVYGGDGNDTLWGEGGQDVLYGGNAHDRLYGGAGNDVLGGADGADALWGGSGDDVLWGGNGNDTLGGNSGNDTIWSGWGADIIYAGSGNNELGGGRGNDTILGSDGMDTLYGAGEDDLLSGGAGNDLIWAGIGDDRLSGDGGNDTLYGAGGSDILNGGAGSDTLSGGAGADTFVFDAWFGADVIADFRLAEGDRLVFDDALWLGTHGVLSAAEVVSTFGSLAPGSVTLAFPGGSQVELAGVSRLEGLDLGIEIV